MSTIDKAFVKAFARRHPAYRQGESAPDAETPSETTSQLQDTARDDAPSGPRSSGQAGADHHGSLQDESDATGGGLSIDQSVAPTAAVWIDDDPQKQLRLDTASQQPVPKPQLPHQSFGSEDHETGDIGAALLAQTHTEFAIGTFSDPPNADAPLEELSGIGIDNAPQAVVAELPTETSPAVAEPPDRQRPVGRPDDQLGQIAVDTLRVDAPQGLAPHHIPDPAVESEETAPASDANEHDGAHVTSGEVSGEGEFRAVWEVDSFDTPAAVAEIFFTGWAFDETAKRMSAAVAGGLRTMLVTSTGSGEGRSTVAIGIAMSLGAAGRRVALVDADVRQPTLTDELRLDLEFGWLDAQRGGLPIEEVAVHSLADGVTLIPLMPPAGAAWATPAEIESLVGGLRDRFDLVIIDGPAGADAVVDPCRAFDTAVIVRDVQNTDAAGVNELSYRLRDRGVRGIGVIENFT